MATVTAQMVKELRDRTGAGMMDSKKALQEADGDIDKAIAVLRERGMAKAAKKEGREASEGVITAYLADDRRSGVILEVNCETDFVARTDKFKAFAQQLAAHVALAHPGTVDEMLTQPYSGESGKTVDDFIKETIATLGENIRLKRFQPVALENGGTLASYIHPGDKLGVMVAVETVGNSDSLQTFARDVAMHIAAAEPKAITRDDVDKTLVDAERAIYQKQAENEGKPAQVIEKIVSGKIDKFLSESVLLEQPYVKDNDKTVGDFVRETASTVGSDIAIKNFARFRLGE